MPDHREPYLVRLVGGEARGLVPSLLRLLLAPPSWLFAAAAETRLALYRVGVFTRHRVPCPVVSVGNITVGGTGKTPVVEWVVRELRLFGAHPVVLSRGYGADGDRVPDELKALGENLSDFRFVRDADRVRGALVAIERHHADSLVLDDGFQHHRIARDLDIVTVDATNPWGGGHCLPRGLLREPVRAVRRADVLLLTRADQVGPARLERLRRRLERWGAGALVAATEHRPVALLPLAGGAVLDPGWLRGRAVCAVSGIGNPAAFETTLQRLGADLVGRVRFRDHEAYPPARLREVAEAAAATGAAAIVTTQKDAVKWGTGPSASLPAFALSVRIAFRGGEEAVRERLRRALGGV